MMKREAFVVVRHIAHSRLYWNNKFIFQFSICYSICNSLQLSWAQHIKKRVQTIKGTVAHANITASKQSSSPPFFRDISHSLKPLESLFLHVWVHFANSSFPLWCFSLIFLLLRFLFQYFLLFHISVHFLLSWFRGVLLTQYFSISNILLSFFFVTLYFKTGIKCFLTNVHFWLFLSPFIFPPAALLDLILVLFTWIRFSPFLSSFSLPFW